MSASVQIVALLLGVVEFAFRAVVVLLLICTFVGLLLLLDGPGVWLTPYLWRKAMP